MPSLKIDLINPPFSAIEKNSSMDDIANILPPLGIGYLAAILRDNGTDVKIYDCRTKGFRRSDFEGYISRRRPDVAGITISTPSFQQAIELAKSIRDISPETIIVAGGPHVTAVPEETALSGFFDFCVLGEAEVTFSELVRMIEQGKKDFKSIPGIAFNDSSGKLFLTEARDYIKNLDALPFPARELYPNINNYSPTPASYRKLPFAHMITSRGCPYQCVFCDRKVFGNKFRARSAGNVLAEIEELIAGFNVNEVKFFDDTFTLSQDRVYEICHGIRNLKKKILWSCLARVDNVSKELLQEMKDSGCWQVGFGIESGDENVLRNSKKGITLNQSKNAVRWAKEAGLNVRAFFIIGFPDDDITTIQKTIDFAKSLKIDVANFYNLTIYPGTELCKHASERGLTVSKDYVNYAQLDLPKEGEVVYLPAGLSAKQLKNLLHKAHKDFYFRLPYIFSQVITIRSFEDIKRYIRGLFAMAGI